MTCLHKIKAFFGHITVEPVLFIYMLATFLQYPATQGLIFTKICLLKYNNSYLCQEISRNDSFRAEESYIQSKTSLWITFVTISLTLPSIITTAFIGSWGDKIDRKIPLVLPCLGGSLAAVCFLINSIFISLPLPMLLLGPLLNGLTGGYITIIMATFSYVTHVTDTRSRTTRVALVEAMTFVAGTLGVVLMGVVLDRASFTLLYSVTASLFALALVYVLVFVKRLRPDSPNNQSVPGRGIYYRLRYYFSLSHMKESFVCAFKRREGNSRLLLWILLTIIAILMICISGQMDILLLFVKHSPLSWPYSLYGYLQGLQYGLRSLLLVSLLPVLKRFGFRDSTLVLAGLLSKIAGLVLLGLSTNTWMAFLVPVLSMLEGYPSAGCRSLISTLVGTDEQGKIFAAIASVESVATLVASLMFNNIYSATEDFYPGLSFQIMAGLCCAALGLILIVHFQPRREEHSVLGETDTDDHCGENGNVQQQQHTDDSNIHAT